MRHKDITVTAACLTVFLLFALTGTNPVWGQTGFVPSDSGQKPPEPFKITVSAVPDTIAAGSTGTIQVLVDIASGYKIYADTVSLSPEAVEGFSFGKVKTPHALEKKEPDGKTALFYQGHTVFELPVRPDSSLKPSGKSIPLEISFRGCSETVCFLPEKRQMEIMLAVLPPLSGDMGAERTDPVTAETGTAGENETDGQPRNAFQEAASKFGLAGVLTAAFLWGLLASLTPCVYPMIPVTVSVIGAGPSKNLFQSFLLSLFYVLGMSLTYAVFGVLAAWSGSLFGAYTDHPAVRILVAGIFVILSLGMFDLVHISMPSRISSRLGAWTGSGFFGVFLTGAATGAVVGPCVGPMLVGLLVYIASIGSRFQGFLIMWSFALGMGMLFLVIGTFSGMASALPRAGSWMENIRRFFGLMMLAVALYYIRPLLPGNVFILLLGIMLTGTGIYTGALDRIQKEATGYEKFRKTLAIVCLVLGIAYTARFVFSDLFITEAQNPAKQEDSILWYDDENAGLRAAAQQGKPVMMDFRADWCAACLQLERDTFTNARVREMAGAFIAIRIDNTNAEAPGPKELRKKYGVVGLPTIIFLDRQGNVLQNLSVSEYIGPADMILLMQKVLNSGQVENEN
ncbi:MAG: protein-disulfide reductase DsbD family protein [Desulfococcaceae bacterium]